MTLRFVCVLAFAAVVFSKASDRSCVPGTYSASGLMPCTNCPPGTWQSNPGSRSCHEANAGWFATGPAATFQVECTEGYYSVGGATSCTTCPAGSYCRGRGNIKPTPCAPGTASALLGTGQACAECPAGTFTGIRGATSCCPCCAGWYNPNSGQTSCRACPNQGKYKQGWSPVGASSSNQCTKASGAISSCRQSGNSCPATGGSSPSSAATRKRNVPLAARPPRCPSGQLSCPIYDSLAGGKHLRTYECIDVEHNLESCGGCVHDDSPNGEKNLVGGRDCSAIPNVDSVRCSSGSCIIEKCKSNYGVSKDGSRCQPVFH